LQNSFSSPLLKYFSAVEASPQNCPNFGIFSDPVLNSAHTGLQVYFLDFINFTRGHLIFSVCPPPFNLVLCLRDQNGKEHFLSTPGSQMMGEAITFRNLQIDKSLLFTSCDKFYFCYNIFYGNIGVDNILKSERKYFGKSVFLFSGIVLSRLQSSIHKSLW